MKANNRDFKVVVAKEKIREYKRVPTEVKLRFLEELILLKSQIGKRNNSQLPRPEGRGLQSDL